MQQQKYMGTLFLGEKKDTTPSKNRQKLLKRNHVQKEKIVFQSPSVFQILAVKLWWFRCENLSLATPRPSALSSKLLKCINLSFVCFVHLNHVQQRLLLLDSPTRPNRTLVFVGVPPKRRREGWFKPTIETAEARGIGGIDTTQI